MLSYIRLTLIYLIVLVICGCTNNSDNKIESLYKQRISNSKYVMYDYVIKGDFVFVGEKRGCEILDSTQIFSENVKPLDGRYVIGKLNIDSLKMVDVSSPADRQLNKSDTLLTPVREYIQNYNGIRIRIYKYIQTYGSPKGLGLWEYNFDSLKETRDSLFFFGITKRDDYSGELNSSKGFVKGNIRVIDLSNKSLDYIQIDQLLIERGKIFEPGPKQNILENRPIVEILKYRFYPKSPMLSSELSDTGIYKLIKGYQRRYE